MRNEKETCYRLGSAPYWTRDRVRLWLYWFGQWLVYLLPLLSPWRITFVGANPQLYEIERLKSSRSPHPVSREFDYGTWSREGREMKTKETSENEGLSHFLLFITCSNENIFLFAKFEYLSWKKGETGPRYCKNISSQMVYVHLRIICQNFVTFHLIHNKNSLFFITYIFYILRICVVCRFPLSDPAPPPKFYSCDVILLLSKF